MFFFFFVNVGIFIFFILTKLNNLLYLEYSKFKKLLQTLFAFQINFRSNSNCSIMPKRLNSFTDNIYAKLKTDKCPLTV